MQIAVSYTHIYTSTRTIKKYPPYAKFTRKTPKIFLITLNFRLNFPKYKTTIKQGY